MSVSKYALEASLALIGFLFVALPALGRLLVSVAMIVASGERLPSGPMRVGAAQRGPAR